jgi:hypothetical protein
MANNNMSMIKVDLGLLIYVPAYKGSHDIEVVSEEEIDDTLDLVSPL